MPTRVDAFSVANTSLFGVFFAPGCFQRYTVEIYVNADENKEDKYENIDSSNSSYILQSGFQADQSAKSVYNGISNIEQNEMFAIKSVGNSKSRSITDDFNLKYLHTLNSKR